MERALVACRNLVGLPPVEWIEPSYYFDDDSDDDIIDGNGGNGGGEPGDRAYNAANDDDVIDKWKWGDGRNDPLQYDNDLEAFAFKPLLDFLAASGLERQHVRALRDAYSHLCLPGQSARSRQEHMFISRYLACNFVRRARLFHHIGDIFLISAGAPAEVSRIRRFMGLDPFPAPAYR